MKKLELNQMEAVEGAGQGRKCFIYGLAVGLFASTAALHPVQTWQQLYAGVSSGGLYYAISDNCF